MSVKLVAVTQRGEKSALARLERRAVLGGGSEVLVAEADAVLVPWMMNKR